MKKITIILVIISLMLIVAFTGCRDNNVLENLEEKDNLDVQQSGEEQIQPNNNFTFSEDEIENILELDFKNTLINEHATINEKGTEIAIKYDDYYSGTVETTYKIVGFSGTLKSARYGNMEQHILGGTLMMLNDIGELYIGYANVIEESTSFIVEKVETLYSIDAISLASKSMDAKAVIKYNGKLGLVNYNNDVIEADFSQFVIKELLIGRYELTSSKESTFLETLNIKDILELYIGATSEDNNFGVRVEYVDKNEEKKFESTYEHEATIEFDKNQIILPILNNEMYPILNSFDALSFSIDKETSSVVISGKVNDAIIEFKKMASEDL